MIGMCIRVPANKFFEAQNRITIEWTENIVFDVVEWKVFNSIKISWRNLSFLCFLSIFSNGKKKQNQMPYSSLVVTIKLKKKFFFYYFNSQPETEKNVDTLQQIRTMNDHQCCWETKPVSEYQ